MLYLGSQRTAYRLAALFAACAVILAGTLRAEQPGQAQADALVPVTTEHVLTLSGTALPYRATVEGVQVHLADGGSAGEVAIISYARLGEDQTKRPVTFVFNGGPGAASAYLHLGAMGPKVVRMAEDGGAPPPPAALEDNPHTWLRFTDLVFIDPVGTGFSRAAAGKDAEKAFWSVSADLDSIAQVIEGWLGRNGRWRSPVFLAGESYGGFRAARLALSLAEKQGIALSGLIMISPALDPSFIQPGPHKVLPWALALPSMVASARAQGHGQADMPVDAVEAFAMGDYLAGIAAMQPAGPEPDPGISEQVAQLLGLDIELVRRWHARVPAWVFAEQHLKGTGRALSVYDGSVSGPDPRPGRPGPDPVLDATKAPLSSAYNAYVRQDLKLETARDFRLLSPEPSRNWNWERDHPDGASGAVDELAEALALIPGLKVLVATGRTDMVTPYLATRWLLDRLDLPDEVRSRIRQEDLEGGHMMYFHASQREALARLAGDFYGSPGNDY